MSGGTILISPLNWGFGHAGRMIPLARELQKRGNEVIFGADAALLPLIENELPGIKLVEIPGLRIRYSRCLPQYLSIFLQLPLVLYHAVREHRLLIRLAEQLKPTIIISDNRFGFFHREIFSVYVTHQVRIPCPRLLFFMEPLAAWLHRMIIRRYDLCMVPDYPGPVNLSGRLSHDLKVPGNMHYMGPLSRFRMPENLSGSTMPTTHPGFGATSDLQGLSMHTAMSGHTMPDQPEDDDTPPGPYCCLILSGPEPQRSMLLEKVSAALPGIRIFVLSASPIQTTRKSEPGITFMIKPDTETMRRLITGSSLVITRAGYTSVMELASLGKGAVLIPTPGQPEQEYLGDYLNGQYGFVSVRQNKINRLNQFEFAAPSDSRSAPADRVEVIDRAVHPMAGSDPLSDNASPSLPEGGPGVETPPPPLPDSTHLFGKAINLLLQQNKE